MISVISKTTKAADLLTHTNDTGEPPAPFAHFTSAQAGSNGRQFSTECV